MDRVTRSIIRPKFKMAAAAILDFGKEIYNFIVGNHIMLKFTAVVQIDTQKGCVANITIIPKTKIEVVPA